MVPHLHISAIVTVAIERIDSPSVAEPARHLLNYRVFLAKRAYVPAAEPVLGRFVQICFLRDCFLRSDQPKKKNTRPTATNTHTNNSGTIYSAIPRPNAPLIATIRNNVPVRKFVYAPRDSLRHNLFTNQTATPLKSNIIPNKIPIMFMPGKNPAQKACPRPRTHMIRARAVKVVGREDG
jgi:hypothetical protein